MYFGEYHSFPVGYLEGYLVLPPLSSCCNLTPVIFGSGNWVTITGIAWDSGSQFHDLLGCGAHLQ